MTGRRWPLAALAAVGVALALGRITTASHESSPPPSATSFESSTAEDRMALEDIAQSRIELVETFQTMLHTAHLYGQPAGQLLADCRSAVADYNAHAAKAGPFWPTNFEPSLNPKQECQP